MIYRLAHSFLTLSVISIIVHTWSNYSRFIELDNRDYIRIPFLIMLTIYLLFNAKVDRKSLPIVKKIIFHVVMWFSIFYVWSSTTRGGLGGDPGFKTDLTLLLLLLLSAVLIFIRNLAIASWLTILGTHILLVHNYNMPSPPYEDDYSTPLTLWAEYSEKMLGISLVIGGVLLFLDDFMFIVKKKLQIRLMKKA